MGLIGLQLIPKKSAPSQLVNPTQSLWLGDNTKPIDARLIPHDHRYNADRLVLDRSNPIIVVHKADRSSINRLCGI
jgi:hypothetical protein